MNQKTSNEHSLPTKVEELIRFSIGDDKLIPLETYNVIIKHHLCNVATSIFSNPGYAAMLATTLSGACEVARVIAADLAPRLFPSVLESRGWDIYLKSSPLAMAAIGITSTFICYIVCRASLEKYKARRGIESAYPPYECCKANVIASVLVTNVPVAGITLLLPDLFTNDLTPLLLLTWILSSLRVVSLVPKQRRLAAIAFPTPIGIITGFALTLFNAESSLVGIAQLSAVLFIATVLWACILGIPELYTSGHLTFRLPRLKEGSAKQSQGNRTPRQWTERSIPYLAAELISLLTALCFIMVVPAFFISLIQLI